MANFLWDLLETAGHVLDTPGSIARGLLAGKNPLPGVFDPAQRTYGRDLLEQYGLLGANQEGLDWGDAAGLGVELVTDPVNLFGGGLFRRLLGNRAAARATARQAVDPALLDAQQKFRLAEALGAEAAESRSIRSVPPGYGPVSRAIDNLDPALAKGQVGEPLAEAARKQLRVGRASQDPVQELLEGFGVGGRTPEGTLELVGPPTVKSVPGLQQRHAWVGADELTPPAVQPSRYTPFPPYLDEAAALSREMSVAAQQRLQDVLEHMARFRQQADSQFWGQSGLLGGSLLGHNALARSSGYEQSPLDPLPDLPVGLPAETPVVPPSMLPAAAAALPPMNPEPAPPDPRWDVAARDLRARAAMARLFGEPSAAPPDPRAEVDARDRRARQMMAQLQEALAAPPPIVPAVPVSRPATPWTMEVYEGTGPNRRVFTQTYDNPRRGGQRVSR